jgi:homoserine O-acetyltransferase
MQRRLLNERFGITRLALAVGHSMGAIQAYHWAALFPGQVERLAAICGAAKISVHNDVFLQGMRGILTADPAWAGGHYTTQPLLGLRTMARAWGAWPPSAHFFRHGYYEKLGYTSAEDFMQRYWDDTYSAMDANNILAQIATWRSADISNNTLYVGNFRAALAAITARAIIMPCVSDAYFPPEDSEFEVRHMTHADCRPIKSQWGHWAGSGRNAADTDFIDAQLKELLGS